ncbi:hypothetical protein FOMPIDRAFT_1038192 [Fomitopsis schrenkii]|uniref:Wax synthase domain-containing protein n=1 Tax=Fomitopsis schrenkii TaxID=2126942 RepID=S8DUS0_FOMSC|nr:hypothetical protein FOMPIDRAFT_1038192 [Fomitopsis schrenkii]
MDTANRPLLPIFPYFACFQTGLACLLALSPPKPGKLVGCAALTSFVALAYFCSTGDAARNYGVGNLMMIQAVTAYLLLWLVNPLHDYRHESDLTDPTKYSFLRRFWWMLSIINNPRGVGWSYEIARLPPRPSCSRWTFVVRKLVCALRWYIFLDLAQSFNRSPWRSLHEQIVGPVAYLMSPVSIIARFSGLVGVIALEQSIGAAVTVALGFWQPRDWPSIYGQWSDSYTVRRFWGRTYHQVLRRLTASGGKACCRALGLRPGTRASSYTQLYVGFAVSGFLHCGGDLLVSPSLFGASFPFFMSQAVAITFEDAVIGLVRKSGIKVPTPIARTVGYAWAITWLCVSAPLYVNWSLLVSLTLPSVTKTATEGLSALSLALQR